MTRRGAAAAALASLAAGACVLLGSPSFAQRPGRTTMQTRNMVGAMDRQFMMKVAQGNIAEVMTSQLALKRASNKDVQMVAQRMIKEHSQSQAVLKRLAAKKSVRLPNNTDPAHRAMYRQLSRLSGTAFDRMYMRGQVRDHNATVALFRKQMERGQDPEVRGYAAEFLPAIQDHTIMIHNTASNIGVPTGAGRTGSGRNRSGGMNMEGGSGGAR